MHSMLGQEFFQDNAFAEVGQTMQDDGPFNRGTQGHINLFNPEDVNTYRYLGTYAIKKIRILINGGSRRLLHDVCNFYGI